MSNDYGATFHSHILTLFDFHPFRSLTYLFIPKILIISHLSKLRLQILYVYKLCKYKNKKNAHFSFLTDVSFLLSPIHKNPLSNPHNKYLVKVSDDRLIKLKMNGNDKLLQDNKMMMNVALPERQIPQAVALNIAEPDRTTSSPQKTSYLRKLRGRLRAPHLLDVFIILLGESRN